MPDFDKNLQPIIKQDSSSDITLNVAPAKKPNPLYVPANAGGKSDLSQPEDIFAKLDRLSNDRFGEKGIFITNKELDANKRYSSFNPTIANYEDFASYGQSALDQAANGLLKGTNLAATTFGGSLSMLLYGLPKALFTQKFSAIYDNEVSRSLDAWNNKVDQEYLPNYKTNKQTDAQWYEKDNWLTTNFLFDSLIKNAGFAVGAMYSGNLANAGLLSAGSKLGSLAMKGASIAEASQAFKLFTPLLRNSARAFSAGKNIEVAQILEKQISSIADLTAKSSEIAKIAQGVTSFNKLNDLTRRRALALYSSAGEASFEALQTAKEYRDTLIEDYKLNNYGKEPDAQELGKIDDLANSVGKTSFFGNVGLLTATEYLQLPYLMGSTYKNSRKASGSLIGKTDDIFLKDNKYVAKEATTKFGKLYDKTKNALEFVADPKEGFQELGQFALQVGTQNYFNKAYQTGEGNVWVDGFLHGFQGENAVGEGVGALNSKEGMESLLLGTITGGLMQAKRKYTKNKKIKTNTSNFLQELNRTPTFKQAFQDRLNAVNRGVVLQQQQQDAVLQGEELEARDLSDDLLHNYLSTRIKYGRYDLIMSDLADVQKDSMTEEGLALLKQQGMASINDTTQSLQKRIAKIQESAKVLEKFYDSAAIRFAGKEEYSPEIIDKLVYSAYKIHAYDQRIPEVSAQLSSQGINVDTVLSDIITKNKPNKEATESVLEEINKKGIEKDELKTYFSDIIELSLRRKLYLDEYQDIKENPENYKTDVDFGASEDLDVSILQKEKGKRKPVSKDIEVGKEYSLKTPVLRQGNKLSLSPKISVLSQTLGGEYEVKLPDGSVTFLTPKDFTNYEVSDVLQNISPKVEEALNKSIEKVISKKKFESLKIPKGSDISVINSLDNKELTDDIQKEFNKLAKELIKREQEAATRKERMRLVADQIKATQDEISKLSDTVPTANKEEVKAKSNIFESMKKAFQYLFTSTTSASVDWEKNLAPHIERFNMFTNLFKTFKNKSDIKTILVTAHNQKELGLDGLAEMSFKAGNLDVSTIKDPLNGFVGAVFIQVDGNDRYFVDYAGGLIGKVGSSVDLNKVIFSTMPSVNLYYSNNAPRYRADQKEEATQAAASYQKFREVLFASDPSKYTMYDIAISKGIPEEASPNPEENSIGGVLIDENQLDKRLVLEVVTKGSIAHEDGNNYTFPNGTVVFTNFDDLVPIYNTKIDDSSAETIYSVLKAISDEANESVSKNQKIFFSKDYLTFLRNVLYFTDQGTKSKNNVYFEDENLSIGGKLFDFANLGDNKEAVIESLKTLYYNVNKKTLADKFTDKFVEFYFKDGKLARREWTNYQTYLLSSKNPDGSARTSTPVYTNVSKPSNTAPFPFKQKYVILQGLADEMPKPVKKEAPAQVSNVYNWDGKTVNTTTISVFKGTPQEKQLELTFVGVIEDGTPTITLVMDDKTKTSLKTAAGSEATVKAAKTILEKAGVDDFDLDIEDPSTEESALIYLEKGLPTLLASRIKTELSAPVKTESTDLEAKKVDIEKRKKEELLKEFGRDESLIASGRIPVIERQPVSNFSPEKAKELVNKHKNITAKYDAELAALEGKAEAKEIEVKGGIKNTKFKNLKGSEFRLRQTGKVFRINDTEIELFKQWAAKNVPNIPYEFLENIIQVNDTKQAWGVFEGGVAKIFKRGQRGTEYHEIFEAVWKAYLAETEQQALLDEFRSNKGSFTDRATGKKIDYNEATDLQAKERIADDFSDYMVGKLPARSLGEKIKRFFKAIVDFFKSFVLNKNLKDSLFSAIDTGAFKNTPYPDVDSEYKAYAEIPGLSTVQIKDYVEHITARIFQTIFANKDSLFDIGNFTSQEIFDGIKEEFADHGLLDDRLDEVYPMLVSFTKDYLRTFNIEFDEDSKLVINDPDTNRNDYANEAFTVNFKKSSPFSIKLLLATLVNTGKINQENKSEIEVVSPDTDISSVGGFTLVPFGKSFNLLINNLSNIRDVNQFVDKLFDIVKKDSDYIRLFKRLGGDLKSGKINFSSYNANDWRLFIQFYQVFTKQKPDGIVQYVDGKNIYSSAANQATSVKQVQRAWTENMKLLSTDKNSLVVYNKKDKIFIVQKNSDVYKSININSPAGKVSFLANLGIDFPMSTVTRLRKKQLKDFGDAVSGIYTSLDKAGIIKSVKGKDLDLSGHLNTLASLYVSVNSPYEDTTFFNNSGKQQQSFTDSNALSLVEYNFNSSKTIDELLEKMPQLKDVFSTNSQILKKGGLFFNEEGERIQEIKVKYILGSKDVNSNSGETVAQLSEGKRLTLEINQNLAGNYYVIVPGDGSTEWMMSMGNSSSFFDENAFYPIFEGYLKDDILLAQDFEVRSKILNVGNKAKKLRFFTGILSKNLLEKAEILVNTKASKEEITNFISENQKEINTNIKSFIEDTVKSTKQALLDTNEIVFKDEETMSIGNLENSLIEKFGLDKENMTSKQVDSLLKYVNTNYIINNIEYHKILFGDPFQYAIKTKKNRVILDATKRFKSFLSPRRITFNTPEFNNFLNLEMNTVGEEVLTSSDYGFHYHKPFLKSVVVKDSEIVGSLSNLKPAYAKTNEADAASWMMDNSYRETKLKNGQWSEEAEAWHQWQMAYTRQNIPGYTYTNKTLEKLDKKLIESPEPKYVIEVLKPIVSGNKYGKDYIDSVLHKFSQMPIYFSAVKGTNLEKLYIKMFKENIDYVIAESGSKVGTEQLHSLYTTNGEFNKEPFNNVIYVSWESYGIQVENSYEKDKLQTRGSQITKLLTLDLYDNGNPISEEADKEAKNNRRLLDLMHQNGYKNLLKRFGITDLGSTYVIKDKSIVAETLRDEMMRRAMSENGIDSLRLDPVTNDFKIPFEASSSYRQIKDILYSIIDKSIASPKMGGFPAVQVPVTMFENKNRGLALKDKEGNYSKISKQEFDTLSEEDKGKVVITDDTLKFYENEDGKRYCEILLPNWLRKEFDKKKFPTDESILEYLNKPENSKILMGIGFRIPTQALSSIEVFKIKGFLPEYMGRTVVVPSEITTKAGSDFDIDKLNMYLKSVYTDSKGNVKLIELKDSEEKTREFYSEVWDKKFSNKKFFKNELLEAMQISSLGLEDTKNLVEKYKEAVDNFISEYEDEYVAQEVLLKQIENLNNADVQAIEKEKYLDRMYKKALENAYYESSEKLLTLPENFDRLTSANTDTELSDIAYTLESLENSQEELIKNKLLNRVHNSKLRHTFITGKRWIGRVAVNITGHSLTQKSKIHVKNASTKISLPHNKVEIDGKKYISLSGILDQAGKYISDKLSMYANASVDVVKDPYLLKIIYSDRLVGTFLFLERIGVPMKQVALMLNQPVIKEYVKQLDYAGVSPFTIKDESIVKKVLNKYPSTTDEILTTSVNTSIQALSDNIYNYHRGGMTSYQNAQQHAILEEFFTYFMLADASFKLTTATNYDTTSFKNADDLYRKQLMTSLAEHTNPISSADMLLSSSFIGEEAKILDKASESLGAILKFNLPEYREVLEQAIGPYARNIYLSKDNFGKIAEKLTASFLDYVVQVKKSNINLQDLLVDNATSVAKKLKELQASHGNEIRILNDLEVVSDRVEGAKSIKLKVNLKEAYDENLYIGYMRELRNHPAAKDFYPELVKLAIAQGSYQSPISIKNIIPLEDYSSIVAPIFEVLSADEDVKEFSKLYSFQKNNWKDSVVVPKITPKFYASEDDLVGLDENDSDVYQYRSRSFPNIEDLGVDSQDRRIMLLHPLSKGASYDVITVPKILNIGGAMVDFKTGLTVTPLFFAQRKSQGEDMNTLYGYQVVKNSEGYPVTNEKGYIVFKQTNLLGDGQYAAEHYVFPTPSIFDNGTQKVENELPDDLIINYFSPIFEENIVEVVPVQEVLPTADEESPRDGTDQLPECFNA